ncbi:MAG: hypothetical protein K1060chlam5_00691 [Candidatus Anoxychlamydiales bacterium]|nr:hypothetical protein [Candidatus Anoxychlamydiales bacterium]
MKITKWMFILMTSFAFMSCNKDNDSNVVTQHFVHKYGFDMSEDEWQDREKEGQSISVLDSGVTVTNSYDNGMLHGATTYTYPNSETIDTLYVYDQGSLVKEVSHDATGLPYKEEVYELDTKKTVTFWDKNGVPISVEQYEDEKLINGKYYKPDNDIEASIQNGSGIRIKRDRDGELISKDTVEKGNLFSRTTYHPNGAIKSKMSFDGYQLHGEQLNYSPTGTVLMEMNWKHGELDGMKYVYQSGKKIKEIPYSNGKKNGVERHFDENSRLLVEIHWENDKKHGSHRVYSEENTDIKWYYKGKAVSLKKFEDFNFREKLIVDKDQFYEMIDNLDPKEAMKE